MSQSSGGGHKGTICLRLRKSSAFYQNHVKIHIVVPQSILNVGSTISFLNNANFRLYRAIDKGNYYIHKPVVCNYKKRILIEKSTHHKKYLPWFLNFPFLLYPVQKLVNLNDFQYVFLHVPIVHSSLVKTFGNVDIMRGVDIFLM